MTKLNSKAKTLLDSCLSTESPESKAKIYEIIAISGLDATDPMFLVLALTGQLRVMLESAPAELSQLLTEWKFQSEQSIHSIGQVIENFATAQESQIDIVRENLRQVSKSCAEEIKLAGIAVVSGVSQAHDEALTQVGETRRETAQIKAEIIELKESINSTRLESSQMVRTLSGQLNLPARTLQTVTTEVNIAASKIQTIQDNTMLVTGLRWFSPLMALALVGSVGLWAGVWLMGNKIDEPTEEFGRNLVIWNSDQIRDCRLDEKKKCTLWISKPPEKPAQPKSQK
ncbi:MAG: hypothetical protein H0X31_00180 [Nostocaceae cyanobacterium]|nr:hypothetical protein [Nostocaceae cyanobacterium]